MNLMKIKIKIKIKNLKYKTTHYKYNKFNNLDKNCSKKTMIYLEKILN